LFYTTISICPGASSGKSSITNLPESVCKTTTFSSSCANDGINVRNSSVKQSAVNFLYTISSFMTLIKGNCIYWFLKKPKLCLVMDADEKIQAHIVSVWREGKGFLTIGGREGMIILTDKHLMFVIKTDAKLKWWRAVVPRQTVKFLKKQDVMIRHDGYDEENLQEDVKRERNFEIPFDSITKIEYENKEWGGVLQLEFQIDEKKHRYQFSVVQDWVKYPVKAPTKYMKVNWTPIVSYVKERQKFTV